MDNHEVKYVPAPSGPTESYKGLPTKIPEWSRMHAKLRNPKSNQFTTFISVLALIISLGFLTLVYTWLWGIPERVAHNEMMTKVLKELVEEQSEKLNSMGSAGKLKSERVCALAKTPGHCFASMPRWYFDKASDRCVQFMYGGCGGNGNNFHTEDACKSVCYSRADQNDHSEVISRNTGKDLTGKQMYLKQFNLVDCKWCIINLKALYYSIIALHCTICIR